MANNSRDETLRIKFESTGIEQVDALGKALEELANSSNSFAPKATEMVEQLNKIGEQTRAIDTFLQLKAAAGETSEKLTAATSGLGDLNAQFDRTDTSSRAVSSAFSKAQAEVSNLTAQHNRLTAQVATAGNALRAQGIDTEHLDAAHRTLQGSLSSVTSEASRLTQQTKQSGEATEAAGEKAKEAGSLFGTFKDHLAEIISIAAAVELALKGIEFGRESISGASALEAQLSRLKAAAADAQGQFAELDDAVEKAAQATNTNSQVAAVGLTALVNGGKSAKDAIDALVPTLQLAKIANIDVAQAADLVGKNLDAFNKPAGEAATVVDLLTAASHGSATALAAISNAAAELAPDARALGLDFDRTVGILGLLADKGQNAGSSVRALRTVFQELQNPASSLRGELLALGDGTGDFNKAIAFLSSGTPRATQALQTLTGGARTVVELLGQAGPEAIQKFTEALQSQNGIAAKTVKVIDDNLKGAYASFSNSIERIENQLAKPVLEPFKDELIKLANELDKFANSPDFKDIQESIGEMAREATRALDSFLHGIDWKSFLNDAKASLSGVVEDLKKVADSAGAIASAIGKTADVVGGAYHVLGAGVDKLVEGTAKAADGVVTLIQKGAELSEGTEKAAQHYEQLHAVLQSTAEEAGGQASKNIEKLGAEMADLAGDANKAAESTKKQGEASAEAAPKVSAHADAAGHAAVQVEDLHQKLIPVGTVLLTAAEATGTLAERLEKASQSALDLKDSSGKTISGVEALKESMRLLGTTSQQALEEAATRAAHLFANVDQISANTAAGLADRQNAFLAYAAAALAANVQLDDAAKADIRARLEQKASILGVTTALADLEKASASSAAAIQSDAHRNVRSFEDMRQTALANAGALSGGPESVASAADAAGDSLEAFKARGTGLLQSLTDGIKTVREGFAGISDAAAAAFDASFKDFFDLGFSTTGTGADRVMDALAKATAETNKQLAASHQELNNMIADINGVGDSATDAFGNLNQGAINSIGSLEAMKREIEDGTYKIGLLGKADLAPLEQALDAAIARAQQLKQAAEAADQEFKSLAQSTADALLQASGNQVAIEEERHRKVLQNLKDAAQKAGELNSQEYRKAVQNENDLFALNIEHIKDEQDAKDKKGKYATPAGDNAGPAGSAGGRVDFGGAGGRVPVQLHHRGRIVHIHADSENEADLLEDMLQQIARSKSVSQ